MFTRRHPMFTREHPEFTVCHPVMTRVKIRAPRLVYYGPIVGLSSRRVGSERLIVESWIAPVGVAAWSRARFFTILELRMFTRGHPEFTRGHPEFTREHPEFTREHPEFME